MYAHSALPCPVLFRPIATARNTKYRGSNELKIFVLIENDCQHFFSHNSLNHCSVAIIFRMVLKSGKEGVYPDLEEFAKRRLQKIKPTSTVLKETKRVQSVRELDKDERAKIAHEIASWTSAMSDQERAMQQSATAAGESTTLEDTPVSLPPIRGQAAIITVRATQKEEKVLKPKTSRTQSGKAISGSDFRAWDKYDVDKALEEIEVPYALCLLSRNRIFCFHPYNMVYIHMTSTQ